jgi:hypothetical protein
LSRFIELVQLTLDDPLTVAISGPQKLDDLPSYPGFERDVFRVVKDYFYGLDEPLMTYEMYEVILKVFSEYRDSTFYKEVGKYMQGIFHGTLLLRKELYCNDKSF